jgi:hypothetical protein
VTALHHGNKSLIVHTAGKEMDVLVLRDVEHIKQQFGSASIADPCFSLPLNCGVPIIEIAAAGSPSLESCSRLLARTSSELFYMRTVNITDHMSTSHNNHKSNPILSTTPEVEMLLEPLQKWQCPVELISMSTSPSEWSYASFLSTSGTLFMWNPLDGLRKFSSDPLVDPNLMAGYSHGSYNNIKDLNLSTALLDFTLHPQILHVALGVALYRTDLRCRLLQKDLIYTTNNSTTRNDICSLKQHGDIGHLFALNTLDGEVLLMDSRYTKTCVAEKVIPEPHSNMKFFNSSTGVTNDKHGLFMGSSSCSRQILMHDVDLTNQNGNHCNSQNEGNIRMESVRKDKERINGLNSKFLSAGRPFGMRSGDLQWDISGYPVISRSGSESLWGFDFIPFQKQNKGDVTDVSKEQLHQKCDTRVLDRNISGILVQQSSLGDVYAQLITYTDTHGNFDYCGQDQNPKKKRAGMHTTTQLGAPCGVSFDIEKYDIIMQNESSTTPKILPEAIPGHILPETKRRALNTKDNTIICNYPLASQAFYPFLDENSMKCMDEVIIEPECFRRDYRIQKSGSLRIDLPPDKTPIRLGNDRSDLLSLFKDGMHEVFEDHMERHGPLTLAEIWTYLNIKTTDKFHTNLNSLREFLDQHEGIFGFICPCPKGVLDIGSLRRGKGTFDGYCMSSSTGSIKEEKYSDNSYDSDKSKKQRDIEDEEHSSSLLPSQESSSSLLASSSTFSLPPSSSSSSANSCSTNQQKSITSPSKMHLKCHCYKLISNNRIGKQTGGSRKKADSRKSVGKGIEDTNKNDGKKCKEKEEVVEFPCRSLSCIIPHLLMYSTRENNIFKNLESKVDSDDLNLSQKNRSTSNPPIRGRVSDVTPLIMERLEKAWMT